MKQLYYLLLVLFSCFYLFTSGQTNSFVTESYLATHFTPKAGITPGTDNNIWLDCDQILTRYQVAVSGVTTTGNRLPSQNQLTSTACALPTVGSIAFLKFPNDLCGHLEITTNVTSDGGCAILERGICYNTTGNPDINSSKITQANTTGSITTDVALPAGSYYFTAYAKNQTGVTYLKFTSPMPIRQCPTVSSTYMYALENCIDYVIAGSVSNLGTYTITDRGAYYSAGTFSQVTLGSPHVSVGSGSSSWETTLTLVEGGDYYAAPYVTLSNGQTILGGSQFIHMDHTTRNYTISPPTFSSITRNSVVVSGYTYNYSCANQVDRGIFYGRTSNPNVWDNGVLIPGDNGTYSISLTGLLPNTTYYVNVHLSYYNMGTVYGTLTSFTTLP